MMDLPENDFKKMTNILKRAEILDSAGKFEEANKLFDENPWVLDYDEDGNWVGPISNENG